jgi:hypothetical protein
MKSQIFTTALVCAVSSALFGQGSIDFGNVIKGEGFIQPVFNYNPANPYVQQVGSPSTAVYAVSLPPAGSTVYGGLPLVGSGYDMVFLYSLNTNVTDVSQMSVATVVPFRTSANLTAYPAGGVYQIDVLNLPGTTGGTPIAFAYAAYSTEGGAIPSSPAGWATVLANFRNHNDTNAAVGIGQIVTTICDGANAAGNYVYVGYTSAQGWNSFSLALSVPAPSGPALSVQSMGAQTVISWPTNASGMSLQSSPDPWSGNWSAVTNIPGTVGDHYTVTIDTSVGSQFYRMAHF